ncbi:MAG: terminase family protein [Pseudomonadota bacterium]
MMVCSRQAGKSTGAAALGTHHVQFNENALALLIAPSLRQSRGLYDKVRHFIKVQKNPPTLVEDNVNGFTLANGSRMVVLPGDDPEKVRGFSAVSLLLLDEAAFVRDSVYTAVTPMLAVSGGQMVEMSTPNGRQGQFHDNWANGGQDIERIEVDAHQCPRISEAFLKKALRMLGQRRYEQEYFCKFNDALDQIFTSEDIARAMVEGVEPLFEGQSGLLSDDVTPLF